LGGYFLYAALAAAAVGLLFGRATVEYPAFIGWTSASGGALFPMLFITIACGACSGFHSLIASGTTSKQLRTETDAKAVGYGAMLLEGLVATVSLCCVMVLAPDSPLAISEKANLVYAQGIGGMLAPTGIPATLAVSFALMAFTTFVYDTLDVCTRLGRYIIQELLGLQNAAGKWIGTILTAGAPLFFVMRTAYDAKGNEIPVWKMFWALFGASNQLLAALTLLGVTVWLWRTRRATWVWFVTGIPTVVMYVMSTWALVLIIGGKLQGDWYYDAVTWVAIVLVALAAMMLVEAARVLWSLRTPTPPAARGAVVAS
jgi:carbon starvation protein